MIRAAKLEGLTGSTGCSEPLRTHYTHEVLETAEYNGRIVGGTQRLSIMLRVRCSSAPLSLSHGSAVPPARCGLQLTTFGFVWRHAG